MLDHGIRLALNGLLFVALASPFQIRGVSAEPKVITNSVGMNLVEIPAGEFRMGAENDLTKTSAKFPYGDPRWLETEFPLHTVRITKPFEMGKYEVTLSEFRQFCDDARYKIEAERDGNPSLGYLKTGSLVRSRHFRPWDPIGWKIDKNHPAIFISWNDAVAFCDWLSKKEGQLYRLPTEAEWEYACRAGSRTEYFYGDDLNELVRFANVADADLKVRLPNDKVAWYLADEKTSTEVPFPFLSGHDGYVFTAPVGKFKPNAFGLHDMLGNAMEWCLDSYDQDYYSLAPTNDPPGPAEGKFKVLRGGGFGDAPLALRCACRLSAVPSTHDYCTGFRVVRAR